MKLIHPKPLSQQQIGEIQIMLLFADYEIRTTYFCWERYVMSLYFIMLLHIIFLFGRFKRLFWKLTILKYC